MKMSKGIDTVERERELHFSKIRNTKGITLVALIVTIIILLILAGITISSLTGSGLFHNANKAMERHSIATIQEHIENIIYEESIQKKGNATLKNIADALENDEKYEFEILIGESENGHQSATIDNAKSIIVVYQNLKYSISSDLKVASLQSDETLGNIVSDREASKSKLINDFNIKVSLTGINAKVDIDGEISTIDNSGVRGYIILVNGEAMEVNKTLPYVVTLGRNTTYKIETIAIDKEANLKRSSNNVQVTTPNLIETVLKYPMLTVDGMVNVKYTNPLDENDYFYVLNSTINCTAADALDKSAYDGDESTCSKVSEGKNKFIVQKGVKQWYVVCKSKKNPYFTFPDGYWGGSDWKAMGNDWWYVKYYGKDKYLDTDKKATTSYDIYELKYDLTHAD